MRCEAIFQMGQGLIGARLKHVRSARGITQEDFASRLGVAYQQIWRWESGKNDPSGEMIVRMARELGVTADYLLGLTDDEAGVFTEEALSAKERQLIAEIRNGKFRDALQTLAALSEDKD